MLRKIFGRLSEGRSESQLHSQSTVARRLPRERSDFTQSVAPYHLGQVGDAGGELLPQ